MSGQNPMQWKGVTLREKNLGGSAEVVRCSPPKQRRADGRQSSRDCISRDNADATLLVYSDRITGELTKSWLVPNAMSTSGQDENIWANSETVSAWQLAQNREGQTAGVDFTFHGGLKIQLRSMSRHNEEFPDVTQEGSLYRIPYSCTAYSDYLDPSPSAGALPTANAADHDPTNPRDLASTHHLQGGTE